MISIQFNPQKGFAVLILFFVIGLSPEILASDNPHYDEICFNKRFQVNKSADQVELLIPNKNGATLNCIIQGFNAEALWCLYQNMSWQQSIEYLSDTYQISKTDSRRKFKHTVYTLEKWGVVSRTNNLAFSTNE